MVKKKSILELYITPPPPQITRNKTMAASSFLLIAAVSLLISPALSITCDSQILSPRNTTFANCTALQALDAVLHWTYSPTPKPTLSVAFTAAPASSSGWVAWGLNPTATGMLGTQALVAFKQPNGSLVVKEYNISSYGGISESKISYDVLNKSAVHYSGGNITIYATLELPEAQATVNQVWQVGAKLTGGVPAVHAMGKDNKDSKGELKLVSGATESPAGSPEISTTPAPTGGNQNGNDTAAGTSVMGVGLTLGMCTVLSLLWVPYFIFY
ncbi:hypothetical protein OROGR_022214 [Orobanche gracilis]